MSKYYLSSFLNRTFPMVSVRFPDNFKLISNDLFELKRGKKDNEDGISILKTNKCFQYSRYLLSFIEKIKYFHKFENKTIITNQIPIRWFYIIKDFYIPDLDIESITLMDYTEKVNKLPIIVLSKIINKATNNYEKRIKIKHPEWKTDNGKISKLTYNFFEFTKILNSLNFEPYSVIYHEKGGIEMRNLFVLDYINLNHCIKLGPVETEVIGKRNYKTTNDINTEDFLIFHLALEKCNIPHDFI